MAGERKFSKAFKSRVVEEYLAGEATQAQLARRYGLSDHLILQWRKRYAEGKLEEISGSTKPKKSALPCRRRASLDKGPPVACKIQLDDSLESCYRATIVASCPVGTG
jgi:transposase-like protein